MSAFTEKEIEYLAGAAARTAGDGRQRPLAPRRPGRLPPRCRGGGDRDRGHALSSSKKWRDLQANPRVAFVVDDPASVNPWTPSGLELRGRAELHDEGGERFGSGWDSSWIRILPQRIVSWGIEAPAFSGAGRRKARSVG